jgi:lipopolysaccharide export LptBFGC system permease protein LptF
MASVSHAVTRIVVLVAIGASLVSLGTMAWAIPAANQAFREEMALSSGKRGPLRKGPSELTLSEVRREMIAAAADGVTVTARRLEWNFHMRLALSAAKVVLAALFVVGFRTDASVRVLLALIASVVYWALLWAGEWFGVHRGAMPSFAAAWLPNGVFAAFVLLIVASRSPQPTPAGKGG